MQLNDAYITIFMCGQDDGTLYVLARHAANFDDTRVIFESRQLNRHSDLAAVAKLILHDVLLDLRRCAGQP